MIQDRQLYIWTRCVRAGTGVENFTRIKHRTQPRSPYLMQKLVQRAIGHEFGDDAEELGLVAHAEDLNDVVEPGLVEHLSFFQ